MRRPSWLGCRRASPGWVLGRHDGEVHVIPLLDLIEHGLADCVCGTTTEPVERADGSFGWIITHHSLDGREAQEGVR